MNNDNQLKNNVSISVILDAKDKRPNRMNDCSINSYKYYDLSSGCG